MGLGWAGLGVPGQRAQLVLGGGCLKEVCGGQVHFSGLLAASFLVSGFGLEGRQNFQAVWLGLVRD